MAKTVRVGGRGTSRRVTEEDEDSNWAGEKFKEYQKKRRDAMSGSYITTGRGTTKIKFDDMPETKGRPSGKGMWVRTGRGTGKRKLE